MVRLLTLFFALSAVTLTMASPDDAAVNERLPVSAVERENHWQVDCAASWRALLAAAADPHCKIEAELRRQLELCSFIYQPPGETATRDCPDFRGSLQYLPPRGHNSRCLKLQSFLGKKTNCPGNT